jgi:predicted hotdog family 3-hydroxylacyl-ACP dehydratase
MILIDREKIASMIPHAGSMCLLDGVLSWDAVSILCVSGSHRKADNPMRRTDGSLGAACGIEIAAQAMAVHGWLVAGNGIRPSRGYLASVRDVRLGVDLLDMVQDDLIIDAERLVGDTNMATYRFALSSNSIVHISGRATVVLQVTE